MLIRECNHELEKFPPIIANMQELQRRKDIKQELEKHKQGERSELSQPILFNQTSDVYRGSTLIT